VVFSISPPVCGRNIAINMFISLSVCLSVCSHISKTTDTEFRKRFRTCYTWRDSVSFWRQCIHYVLRVLWITSCFHIMKRVGQNRRGRVCFIELARWRHWERILPSPTASCLMRIFKKSEHCFFFEVSHLITTFTIKKILFRICFWNKMQLETEDFAPVPPHGERDETYVSSLQWCRQDSVPGGGGHMQT